MKQKKYTEYSKKTKKIISDINYEAYVGESNSYLSSFDEGICRVEEVMDAMNYIVKAGWLGKVLYARMVLYESVFNHVVSAIEFTGNLNDFDTSHRLPIEQFPLIIGKYDKEQVSVSIFEDDENYTLEQWRDKHNINLKVGDPVMIFSGDNISFEGNFSYAYYTGKQKVNDENGEIRYVLSPGLYSIPHCLNDEIMYIFPHGVGTNSKYELGFLTIPEYQFYMNCHFEKIQKITDLLSSRQLSDKRLIYSQYKK